MDIIIALLLINCCCCYGRWGEAPHNGAGAAVRHNRKQMHEHASWVLIDGQVSTFVFGQAGGDACGFGFLRYFQDIFFVAMAVTTTDTTIDRPSSAFWSVCASRTYVSCRRHL